ncbi:MAG: hypothetical protein ACREUU_15795, partial [Gammaproteobacteria bacterium]
MRFLILALLFCAALAAGQAPEQRATWAPLRPFVGEWESSTSGKPGAGKVEVHEDWGVISYDRARRTFVFRQFHVEGFVNQYVLQEITP